MNVEVVVPTRNGAKWLRQFLVAYRGLGVEPLYIVDTRSDDGTEELLRSAGARVAMFQTGADFIEGSALEFASQRVEQDSILRIDDDEFPSSELIRWAEDEGCKADVECWGISRLTLFNGPAGIKYSRIETQFHSHPHIVDAQFRLYRHKRVKYLRKIHQAGFSFSIASHVPPGAFLIHCDLLLRNADERLEKLRRYEAIEEGSSWKFAYHYLPELFPKVDQRLAPLNTTEFDSLLNALPRPQISPAALTLEERKLIFTATREHRLFIRRQWRPSDRQARLLNTPFANKTLAEFICTIAKAVRFIERALPKRMQRSGWLHELGDDLYNKSAFRLGEDRF